MSNSIDKFTRIPDTAKKMNNLEDRSVEKFQEGTERKKGESTEKYKKHLTKS